MQVGLQNAGNITHFSHCIHPNGRMNDEPAGMQIFAQCYKNECQMLETNKHILHK